MPGMVGAVRVRENSLPREENSTVLPLNVPVTLPLLMLENEIFSKDLALTLTTSVTFFFESIDVDILTGVPEALTKNIGAFTIWSKKLCIGRPNETGIAFLKFKLPGERSPCSGLPRTVWPGLAATSGEKTGRGFRYRGFRGLIRGRLLVPGVKAQLPLTGAAKLPGLSAPDETGGGV